ncbi:probable E3 ubiquitin-protein ligase HECTD2 isoform X2 [Mercenaria mercenaria]|uniref:probable E3 ubiquitin-protein ligase HECTD2 isoform X2 n=1 Tax=Mercenaria mercenaria TaxID=6596 RepID=UPI001E1D62CC|nr:probable E3 ubiquitin-protein ligase HECTD2 isoform X2 [Mercenaria mercenaria]
MQGWCLQWFKEILLMSGSTLMASSSTNADRYEITCPTCDFTSSVPNGSHRTICPKCGGFYSREAAEKREPRRLPMRNEPKEKRSNGRRGLNSIANFFNNLTPNNSNKSKKKGLNNVVSTQSSESSSSSDISNTELPPINNKSRLTVQNARSGSTTPSYGLDSRASSRNTVISTSSKASKTSKGTSVSRQDIHLNISSKPKSSDNAGAGVSSTSQNQADRVIYPVRTKTSDQLREDVRSARETGNWKSVQEFYSTTFDSFLEINAAFKRDPNKDYKGTEDPGLKFDFINTVYDLILGLPPEIQKIVLKSIINSLLKDKKPHSKDDLRAYLVLLQNPQFGSSSTYVIFAHLLRQIAALTDHDHHYLVYWMRKLSGDRLQALLERLNSFISIRLFPPKPQDLPPMVKCSWWIPSGTKVMALLNAANNLCQPPLVSHMEFYNMALDNLDLMQEYLAWQDPNSSGGFSFCQYPFILSITAKRTILQRDSEQQMILMARRSLVAKVQRRQLPDVGMLFFNLTVRRENLVSDSLNEIAKKQHDLKKKLKVTFAGEPGLDMGGLTKEWFLLLIKKIFNENYGMFTYNKVAGCYWFSTMHREDYQEFNLVGVLMGLAVYNSINLDLRFPPCCYKKLLSPPVVPFNNPRAQVGVASLTLKDLKRVQPEVAKGLQDLLDYTGDVEEDFCMSFQMSQDHYGHTKTFDLKPDGANIPVTSENRKEYVDLYVDWVLNKSVYNQFKAFYHGFHMVCASNALIMLRPEEIEMLVCGNPKLDMKDLKKVTVYDGYHNLDPTIKYFWDVVLSLPIQLQKLFLLFTTGSDRIPIGGMAEMTFKISRTEDTDLLPMAHTCFNQLVLPAYKSKKQLRNKIILAIQNAEGFGLE